MARIRKCRMQNAKFRIREISVTIVTNHAIPTGFSRCELCKLLHRSKFGKKGLCPQITQMDADEELFFFVSASICVNLRAILDSVAAGRAGKSVAKIRAVRSDSA